MQNDRIISALIGLAGACNNNPKTEHTDHVMIKSLAFSQVFPEADETAYQEIVNEIHMEKYTLSPDCATCMMPCGNTSDYDMEQIYNAESGIREIKLRVLEELQKTAVHLYQHRPTETNPQTDYLPIYKALIYMNGYTDETILSSLLKEVEEYKESLITV